MPSECVVCKAFLLSSIDELEPIIQEGLYPKKDVSGGDNQAPGNQKGNDTEFDEATTPEVTDKHEELDVKLKRLHHKISNFQTTGSSLVDCCIEKRSPSTARHVHIQMQPIKIKKLGQGLVHYVLINYAMRMEKPCLVSVKITSHRRFQEIAQSVIQRATSWFCSCHKFKTKIQLTVVL
eukprot:Seg1194.5 transcript_id=Seg1194.5/GoldUCD/mRNA.D3Y31 product="hypothetical protein" protein_id=Seg1194.5/GoldUCD/D3Y31